MGIIQAIALVVPALVGIVLAIDFIVKAVGSVFPSIAGETKGVVAGSKAFAGMVEAIARTAKVIVEMMGTIGSDPSSPPHPVCDRLPRRGAGISLARAMLFSNHAAISLANTEGGRF
jgi:hypothetical protein